MYALQCLILFLQLLVKLFLRLQFDRCLIEQRLFYSNILFYFDRLDADTNKVCSK